jgi:hypothetical protein
MKQWRGKLESPCTIVAKQRRSPLQDDELIDDLRFRDLTSNIKEGTLYFALANIKAASSDRLIPPEVLAQLDKALRDVNKALSDAEQGLSLVREDEVLGKLRYTFWHGEGGKHRLDKLFGALKSSCDKLQDLCMKADRKSQT